MVLWCGDDDDVHTVRVCCEVEEEGRFADIECWILLAALVGSDDCQCGFFFGVEGGMSGWSDDGWAGCGGDGWIW